MNQIKNLQKTIENFELESQNFKKQISTLESEKSSTEKKYESLLKENASTISELERDNDILEKKVESMLELIKILQKSAENCELESDAYKNQASASENEKSFIKEKYKRLLEENSRTVSGVSKDYALHEKQVESLMEQIKNLQKRIENYDLEIENYKKQISNSESEKSSTEDMDMFLMEGKSSLEQIKSYQNNKQLAADKFQIFKQKCLAKQREMSSIEEKLKRMNEERSTSDSKFKDMDMFEMEGKSSMEQVKSHQNNKETQPKQIAADNYQIFKQQSLAKQRSMERKVKRLNGESSTSDSKFKDNDLLRMEGKSSMEQTKSLQNNKQLHLKQMPNDEIQLQCLAAAALKEISSIEGNTKRQDRENSTTDSEFIDKDMFQMEGKSSMESTKSHQNNKQLQLNQMATDEFHLFKQQSLAKQREMSSIQGNLKGRDGENSTSDPEFKDKDLLQMEGKSSLEQTKSHQSNKQLQLKVVAIDEFQQQCLADGAQKEMSSIEGKLKRLDGESSTSDSEFKDKDMFQMEEKSSMEQTKSHENNKQMAADEFQISKQQCSAKQTEMSSIAGKSKRQDGESSTSDSELKDNDLLQMEVKSSMEETKSHQNNKQLQPKEMATDEFQQECLAEQKEMSSVEGKLESPDVESSTRDSEITDNEFVQKKIKSLTERIEVLVEKANETYEVELENYREQISALESEKSSLEKKNKSLLDENSYIVPKLKKENALHEKEIHSLKEQIKRLQKTIGDNEVMLRNFKKQINALESEKSSIVAKYKILTTDLRISEKDNDLLEKESETMTQEIKNLKRSYGLKLKLCEKTIATLGTGVLMKAVCFGVLFFLMFEVLVFT